VISEKTRARRVLASLRELYPNSTSSLKFRDPFQLLMAVILSAQCTDERVNQVAPKIFDRYPDAESLSKASLEAITKTIQSLTYFNQKAKALIEASRQLVELHQGQVPSRLESLVALRGVGRKTANVIRGVIFGKPALVIDTHVQRLSFRLGFTNNKSPLAIEKDLAQLIPKKDWIDTAHLMIDHGRAICGAKKTQCSLCGLKTLCPKRGLLTNTVE
jgi:endonuclease III